MAKQFVCRAITGQSHEWWVCGAREGGLSTSSLGTWTESPACVPSLRCQPFKTVDRVRNTIAKGEHNSDYNRLCQVKIHIILDLNTFWVSASSSSTHVTSFSRWIASCSSWLRSITWVWWDARRLLFRQTLPWALWGEEQRMTAL